MNEGELLQELSNVLRSMPPENCQLILYLLRFLKVSYIYCQN